MTHEISQRDKLAVESLKDAGSFNALERFIHLSRVLKDEIKLEYTRVLTDAPLELPAPVFALLKEACGLRSDETRQWWKELKHIAWEDDDGRENRRSLTDFEKSLLQTHQLKQFCVFYFRLPLCYLSHCCHSPSYILSAILSVPGMPELPHRTRTT